MYVQDRLRTHAEELTALLSSDRALVYICGLAGMELGIMQGLARSLPPAVLPYYLHVDSAVMNDIDAWDRRMIHKQIRPTRRVFVEVY